MWLSQVVCQFLHQCLSLRAIEDGGTRLVEYLTRQLLKLRQQLNVITTRVTDLL